MCNREKTNLIYQFEVPWNKNVPVDLPSVIVKKNLIYQFEEPWNKNVPVGLDEQHQRSSNGLDEQKNSTNLKNHETKIRKFEFKLVTSSWELRLKNVFVRDDDWRLCLNNRWATIWGIRRGDLVWNRENFLGLQLSSISI